MTIGAESQTPFSLASQIILRALVVVAFSLSWSIAHADAVGEARAPDPEEPAMVKKSPAVDLRHPGALPEMAPELRRKLPSKPMQRIGVGIRSPRTLMTPAPVHESARPGALPKHFDLRDQYPNHPEPRNQGQCGNCYVVSTIAAADWAYAIEMQKRGLAAEPVYFSVQAAMDCGNFGCSGGHPLHVFQFLEERGVPLAADYRPYDHQLRECKAYRPRIRLKGSSSGRLSDTNAVKLAIYRGTPVVFTMHVHDDFRDYQRGVYRHSEGGELGMKSNPAIGWGTLRDGRQYWIAANTWGPSWGEDGHFRIAMDDPSLANMLTNFYEQAELIPPAGM